MILTKLAEIPLNILGLCPYIPGTWEYYFMFRWENILTLVAWSYVLQMRLTSSRSVLHWFSKFCHWSTCSKCRFLLHLQAIKSETLALETAICVLTGSPGFPYILSFDKHCSNPFIISAMCVCDDKPKVICMSGLEEIKTVTQ